MKKVYNLLFILTIMLMGLIGLNNVKADNEITVDAYAMNGNNVSLNFTLDDESIDIQEYKVYRSPLPGEDNSKPILIGTTTDSYYDLTDLIKNTTYTFNIIGVIDEDNEVSGNVEVTTPNYEINAEGEAINGNWVRLNWDEEEGVQEYKIYRSASPDEEASKPIYVGTTEDNTYLVKGLEKDTDYRFHVTAVINEDESYEDYVDVTTLSNIEHFGISIAGEEFTSENETIKCGKGTATFDDDTKTLTLHNATIKNKNEYISTIATDDTMNLIIVLKGNNTITSYGTAINTNGGHITILGNDNSNDDNLHIVMPNKIRDYTYYGYFGIIGNNVVIDSAEIYISGYFREGIDGANVTIKDSLIRVTEATNNPDSVVGIYADYDINIQDGSTIKLDAENGLESYAGTITITDGNITISGDSPVTGNLDLTNYNGKIMAGEWEDSTNASLYNKNSILEVLEDIEYLKLGDFETYSITSNSNKNIITDLPSQAFKGERIRLYWDYSWAYDIDKIQILKASDQTDITDDVYYNNTLTMPDYPIIIKTTFKNGYDDAPYTATPKLTSYNSVNFTWEDIDADGYYVYYKRSTVKNFVYLGKTTKTNYKVNNLKKGVKYDFKVVPYVVINKETLVSKSSKISSVYTLKKLATPTIKKYNDKKIKITYTKLEGATGYEIARSKNKTIGFKVVKTVSTNTNVVNIKATKGKKYYYKVRAFKTVNGKKVYAPWSDAKKFKLK